MRFTILLVLVAVFAGCGPGTKRHVVAIPKTKQPVLEQPAVEAPAPELTAEEKLLAKFKDVIARHRKTAGDDTEKELLALFDHHAVTFNDFVKTLSGDERTISLKVAGSDTVYKKVLLLPSTKPKAGKIIIKTDAGIKIVLQTENVTSIWFSGFPSTSWRDYFEEGMQFYNIAQCRELGSIRLGYVDPDIEYFIRFGKTNKETEFK